MSDIAASIDLRDATLYYYFPNKQALVYDCHVRSLERFERLIVDATAFDGNGLERIKQFVRTLIDDHSRTAPNCTLETIRTLSRSSAIISQRGPIDCGTCLRLF
ncbi:TetR/AcrR family transcriptional regulator [Sphingomonas sp. PAMC 26621]|uniref:TetR/AcrR family transcriptional regulator n=1 Tax=Sphingomonas sp. PAMC 26621 TaxID=1112213 RepID=UPI001EE6816A|nr:TetR/AcrR family transcriptional regulator [Sphingomonas sp. PAMC 26621]